MVVAGAFLWGCAMQAVVGPPVGAVAVLVGVVIIVWVVGIAQTRRRR